VRIALSHHLGRQLRDRTPRRVDAGVVHEDVDDAERLHGLVEQRAHLLLVADVGLDDDGSPSRLLDALAGTGGAVGVLEVAEDDIGTFLCELHSRRLADARVRTGDDRDLAVQLSCRHGLLLVSALLGRCRLRQAPRVACDMDTGDILGEAFARVSAHVRDVTEGLDGAVLCHRPDRNANSIAWLVWHATRVQDDHVAEIARRDQVYARGGWAERLALPLEVTDTGYGHTAEQVAAVRVDGPDLLVGYHDAVARETSAYVSTVDAAELDRVIDDRWDPPVTVGVRLVSVIDDVLQHLGQARYVRGIVERSASGGE
jgi:hypothetical protein